MVIRVSQTGLSALEGILALSTGCRWRDLPTEMTCESGVTCWRRLRDWEPARVWMRLHRARLDRGLASRG